MWEHFKEWVSRPYREDMDALGWFLFFGLMVVIAATWAIVLTHLKEAAT